MALRNLLIVPSLLLLATTALYSQSDAPNTDESHPTFRSKVHTVLVDVVVTDSHNKAVSGLKKDDFQIFEHDKLQTITSFQEYTGEPVTAPATTPLPTNVFTNYPEIVPGNAVTVILLDALNTPLDDQLFTHQQVVNYFKSMKAGTPVAIFKLSTRLRLVQGFTADAATIMTALDDKKAGAWPEVSPILRTYYKDSLPESQQLSQAAYAGPRAPQANIDATRQFQADGALFNLDIRVQNTLTALQDLASYLSSIPGRKNVVWFSRSFPLVIFPNQDGNKDFNTVQDFSAEVRKTTTLLTKAQVALYPIDAGGLGAGDVSASMNDPALSDPSINPALAEANANDAAHLTMDTLAHQTGGRAAYNTNGLTESLEHAVQHGTHYYTLSYSPTNKKMDGAFRAIQVKLASGDYKLDYRRGYFADDAKSLKAAAKNASDPLQPFMARGLPSSDQFTYRILIQPADHQPALGAAAAGDNAKLKGPVTRYEVVLKVKADEVMLKRTSDGTSDGTLETALVVYDREGTPLNWLTKTIKLNVKPPQNGTPEEDFAFTQEIDVPQGDVYLRSGIYDLGSNKIGTLEIPLSAVTMAAIPAKSK